MTTEVELEGMTVSINYNFNGDDLEIESVNWFKDSYNFLVENVEHSCLEKFQYRELGNEDYINEIETIINFYQLSHYEQLEIIKNMLNYDKRFTSEFVEDLRPTRQDYEYGLAELRGEAMREGM